MRMIMKKELLKKIVLTGLVLFAGFMLYREYYLFNVVYRTCGNPDIIERVEIIGHDGINSVIMITDPANIASLCEALNNTEFRPDKSRNSLRAAINGDYSVILQPIGTEYDYALSFPVGRVFKRKPGSKMLSSFYRVVDMQYLDKWVSDMRLKYQ